MSFVDQQPYKELTLKEATELAKTVGVLLKEQDDIASKIKICGSCKKECDPVCWNNLVKTNDGSIIVYGEDDDEVFLLTNPSEIQFSLTILCNQCCDVWSSSAQLKSIGESSLNVSPFTVYDWFKHPRDCIPLEIGFIIQGKLRPHITQDFIYGLVINLVADRFVVVSLAAYDNSIQKTKVDPALVLSLKMIDVLPKSEAKEHMNWQTDYIIEASHMSTHFRMELYACAKLKNSTVSLERIRERVARESLGLR